jgi:hypothetical protein
MISAHCCTEGLPVLYVTLGKSITPPRLQFPYLHSEDSDHRSHGLERIRIDVLSGAAPRR